ncbi:type IV pilin [Vibrio azureus]|uniref:type IV pilus modification PilV family protein n=1 Tax=Vibrio azureus TaxID=512649 RepID=UPI0005188FC4|nr:prepilin-type N-terminal cleavage/methylation domain-containing protein [Vibrio azureus]AUI85448.1 type IV pilin [Vibrio azureus]
MIRSSRGFSLIEVLVSLLLVSIGGLGLLKLQVFIERQSDYALHSIEALRLAENQLEWFRTRGASDALSTVSSAQFSTITSGSYTAGNYTLSWQATAEEGSSSLKSVVMTATWQNRLEQTQSVELHTMLSRFNEFEN